MGGLTVQGKRLSLALMLSAPLLNSNLSIKRGLKYPFLSLILLIFSAYEKKILAG